MSYLFLGRGENHHNRSRYSGSNVSREDPNSGGSMDGMQTRANFGSVSCVYDEYKQSLTSTWIIPDYRMVDVTIMSPPFGVMANRPVGGEDYKHLWHMTLHPNGSRRSYAGFVSIYLYCETIELQPTVRMTIKLSRMYGRMESTYHQTHQSKSFGEESGGFGFHHYIHRSYLTHDESHFMAQDGSLTVTAIIQHLSPDKDDHLDVTSLALLSDQMFEGYEENSERYADVTFEVEGKELMASKAVLASRSSVFRAMFESGMSESAEPGKMSQVKIEDVEYHVMRAVLRYIYSGAIREDIEDPTGDNSIFVIKLFAAADKYALDYLKSVCENFVCANLSEKNVSLAMIAGHLHDSNRIKGACFIFVADHDVKQIDDWGEVHKYDGLLDEMLSYWHQNKAHLNTSKSPSEEPFQFKKRFDSRLT